MPNGEQLRFKAHALVIVKAFWPVAFVALFVWATLYITSHGVRVAPDSWWSFFFGWLDVARWGIMGPSANPALMLGDAIMYIAILSVMLLVLLNTGSILFSFGTSYRHEDDLGISLTNNQVALRNKYRSWRSLALGLLVITVVLLAIWFVSSVTGYFYDWFHEHFGLYRFPARQQMGHEIVSALVFLVFLIIDSLLWRALKHEIGLWEEISKAPLKVYPDLANGAQQRVADKIESLRNERRFQVGSIWFIDLPVLVGAVAIMCLHWYLHEYRFDILADRALPTLSGPVLEPGDRDLYFNATEHDDLLPIKCEDAPNVFRICAEKVSRERQRRRFDGFLQGVSTGGIMMHIAISQFILGVLLVRFLLAKR